MRDSVLRSVPPGRTPAVAGCAENQKLPKINARVIRNAAVGLRIVGIFFPETAKGTKFPLSPSFGYRVTPVA